MPSLSWIYVDDLDPLERIQFADLIHASSESDVQSPLPNNTEATSVGGDTNSDPINQNTEQLVDRHVTFSFPVHHSVDPATTRLARDDEFMSNEVISNEWNSPPDPVRSPPSIHYHFSPNLTFDQSCSGFCPIFQFCFDNLSSKFDSMSPMEQQNHVKNNVTIWFLRSCWKIRLIFPKHMNSSLLPPSISISDTISGISQSINNHLQQVLGLQSMHPSLHVVTADSAWNQSIGPTPAPPINPENGFLHVYFNSAVTVVCDQSFLSCVQCIATLVPFDITEDPLLLYKRVLRCLLTWLITSRCLLSPSCSSWLFLPPTKLELIRELYMAIISHQYNQIDSIKESVHEEAADECDQPTTTTTGNSEKFSLYLVCGGERNLWVPSSTEHTDMPRCSSVRTRSECARLSNILLSHAQVKGPIFYNNGARHMVGQAPRVKLPPKLLNLQYPKTSASTKRNRLKTLQILNNLHQELKSSGIMAPRDLWEEWLAPYKDDGECDIAFMCLVIILMSSSTSDDQLSKLIPRLFIAGLTSASAVIDVTSRYGVDCLCSLFAESGRYYQNAERILNAADYFFQKHNGRIPRNVSVAELCTLHGVGYKTANIVLSTAFNRIDGIPSDVHVMRWSYILRWSAKYTDGLACSKYMESWLPKAHWHLINPLFGSLGQLLGSKATKDLLFGFIKTKNGKHLKALMRRAEKEYIHKKKPIQNNNDALSMNEDT